MKKSLSILALFLAQQLSTYGQSYWDKTYGDGYGSDVHLAIDSGFIVGANAMGYPLLVKTNDAGDSLWSKVIPMNVTLASLEQTYDSGYFFCGSITQFSTNAAIAIKLNSNADSVWGYTFGTAAWGRNGLEVFQLPDSTIVMTDLDNGPMYQDDYTLTRFNSSGTILASNNIGYSGSDSKQTLDGKFISVNNNYVDQYPHMSIVKSDNNGIDLWRIYYGDTSLNQTYGYSGSKISITSDSGFVVLGNSYMNSPGNGENMIMRTDMNGDSLWTKFLPISAPYYPVNVVQTPDGGFAILITSTDTAGLMKTDAAGNFLWVKYYSGMSYTKANNFIQLQDGSFVIVGTTWNHVISYQVYLFITDSSGSAFSINVPEISPGDVSIKSFPNPFHEFTTVSIISNTELKNLTFYLYDALGKEVTKFHPQSSAFRVMRETLPPGIYFYKLDCDKRIIGNGKLMIE